MYMIWDLSCFSLSWLLYSSNKEFSRFTITWATVGWCLPFVAGSWVYLIDSLWILLWTHIVVLLPKLTDSWSPLGELQDPHLLHSVSQAKIWPYPVRILPRLKSFTFQWCYVLVCYCLGSGFREAGTISKWEKPHCCKALEKGICLIVEQLILHSYSLR